MTATFFMRKQKPREHLPAGLAKWERNWRAVHAHAGTTNLALRELEPFASARLAVFLALLHARVACEQAVGFQRRAQARLRHQQGAGDAMTDRPRLTSRTSPAYVDARVKARPGLGYR